MPVFPLFFLVTILYAHGGTCIGFILFCRSENMTRKAAGEEPLPEEDPSNPIFKPIPEPSRLGSFLITNQMANYCNQINGYVTDLKDWLISYPVVMPLLLESWLSLFSLMSSLASISVSTLHCLGKFWYVMVWLLSEIFCAFCICFFVTPAC